MIHPNMSKYLPSLSLSKLSVSVAALFVSAFVLVSPVSAYELSPSNMVLQSGASNTVNILATDTTTNGVSVHITMEGLQVTEFEAGEGILNIGICENGSAFDDAEVCVDLAGRDEFVQGQLLASFTVVKTGQGDATMTIGDDNKYANGNMVSPTSFKVVESEEGLPQTEDRTTQALNNVLPLLIIAGIVLILIVLLLVYILRGRKSSHVTTTQPIVSQAQSTGSTDTANADKPMLPPLN